MKIPALPVYVYLAGVQGLEPWALGLAKLAADEKQVIVIALGYGVNQGIAHKSKKISDVSNVTDSLPASISKSPLSMPSGRYFPQRGQPKLCIAAYGSKQNNNLFKKEIDKVK